MSYLSISHNKLPKQMISYEHKRKILDDQERDWPILLTRTSVSSKEE